MKDAFIVDYVRTPIGRFGGSLATVRTDDLAALPMRELLQRNPDVDPAAIEDVIYGCANQAGEDNRNVARMALLLAGLPVTVPGETVNRLCASGMSAIAHAGRAIAAGDAGLMIAGGVESMTRAPYVMSKSAKPFGRDARLFDTSIGWRFVNPRMRDQYGVDGMGNTAENVANEYRVSRQDQDLFALRSQQKATAAGESGRLKMEIMPVEIPMRKGAPLVFEKDEFIRPDSTIEKLAALRPAFDPQGSVTAGNASGINDGAAALLIASASAAKQFGLRPRARIVASAVVGLEPRIMGMGPLFATRKVLKKSGLSLNDMDVIELNEAFASQSLACVRELGLDDDDPRINCNGGAIAIGHPLGMSGARITGSAMIEIELKKAGYALCTMCVGVGQGMAMIIERA